MIKPTIGRVMWYWPAKQQRGDQPYAVFVAYVHGDNMVNVGGVDSSGRSFAATNVPIVQDGSPYTVGDSPYCEWMPFQKGQAAKYEAEAAKNK